MLLIYYRYYCLTYVGGLGLLDILIHVILD